jgi:hypothetical protein
MLATGYRLTGDGAFRDRIAERLEPHVTDAPLVPPDRQDWFGPRSYLRPKTVSMVGFLMSGLPYVQGAVPNEQTLWPDGLPDQPDPSLLPEPTDPQSTDIGTQESPTPHTGKGR